MAKWARLQNNYVAEVITFDPIGLFDPTIIWKQVPEYVDQHYTFSEDEDGNITWHEPILVRGPTEEEIAELKRLAEEAASSQQLVQTLAAGEAPAE